MVSTKSRNVALLEGNAPPRVLHAPARVRSNAWEDVADLGARYGLNLDPWQERVLQAAMGERSDGRWASPQVALSAPRQNGKSEIIVARALAGVLLFGERNIVCSAHQQDTAREVFQRIVDLCEASPDLDKRVAQYGRALNREYIRFESGQVIRFKARSKGGGRGFSCDCLLLDEAQILSGAAWAAILPTMSARPNSQVWLLGTPPTPLDDGDVFGRFRSAGLEGKSGRLAYLEWSAQPEDDFDDPATWAKANPAYPFRISHDAILGERASMTDEQFAMERLGMWADEARQLGVFPPGAWEACRDDRSLIGDWRSVAVDVSPDGSFSSVAVCGPRSDGRWHVEMRRQRDTRWVVDAVADQVSRHRVDGPVVLAGRQAVALKDPLVASGVEVLVMSQMDYLTACAQFAESVGGTVPDVVHIGQDELDAAVGGASWRETPDGRYLRRRGAVDTTPLIACVAAKWAAVRFATEGVEYDLAESFW